MAILSEHAWRRHANPWSGWSRALSMPFLAAGLYLHDFWVLGAVILWLFVNPFIFPEPKSTDNWMSKGVIGEKIYYADGVKLKKDLPTLLNFLNLPASISFIYFGWVQELASMILAGFLVITIKFWFVDRMALLAEKAGETGGGIEGR